MRFRTVLAVAAALAVALCAGNLVQAPAAAKAGVPAHRFIGQVAADGAPPAPITFAAVGDISLARELVPRMENEGADYPFALVEPDLRADIVFGNLEGALTERGEPWAKGFTFRTPPSLAGGLRHAGFAALTVANNHIFDFGANGLADSLATLDQLGIAHAGAGADADAAAAPAIITVGGQRVAVLGYVATPTEVTGFSIDQWAAGPGRPGVAIGTTESVRAGVSAARAAADFVVVAIHAGTEYSAEPDGTQRALAEAALDAGADVVLGAHPHVLQPIEWRGRQLLAWSLGNFVFDLDASDLANLPEPRLSVVLHFTLTPGKGVTDVSFQPVVLDADEDRPRRTTPAEAASLAGLISRS